MADEAVAAMLFRFGADISELKTKMDEASARLEKFGRTTKRQLSGLRGEFKALKEPISSIAQLANSMGTAFGGAASKATGLVNGLVGAASRADLLGVAVGAAAGLLAVLVSRFTEAGEAAEKASKQAVAAREEQNRKIQETIDKLKEENRQRGVVLRGESPEFATAQQKVTDASKGVESAQAEVGALEGQIEILRQQAAQAQEAKRVAVDKADRDTRAGVAAFADAEIRSLLKQVTDLEVLKGAAVNSLRLAKEAAAEARKGLEGAALTDLSTPITPETQTPPGAAPGAAAKGLKLGESAAAKRKALEEKTARELADFRLATAQGEDEKAIAQYQNRIDQIAGMETLSVNQTIELRLAAEEELSDRLAQINAERTERALEAGKDAAKTSGDAAAEAAAAKAREEANEIGVTFGILADVSGLLVDGLTGGFASISDFAAQAGKLVLGLIAQLVQAALVAALLSAILGSVTGGVGSLAGVGGLVGIIGKGFGLTGFAEGGRVGSTDTVPAMLTPGEFVMPVSSVQRYGVDVLEKMRRAGRMGFADGGLVPGGGPGGSTVQIIQAFDAPAIARNSERLEGVQTRRINNRQGALVRETLRRNLRG